MEQRREGWDLWRCRLAEEPRKQQRGEATLDERRGRGYTAFIQHGPACATCADAVVVWLLRSQSDTPTSQGLKFLLFFPSLCPTSRTNCIPRHQQPPASSRMLVMLLPRAPPSLRPPHFQCSCNPLPPYLSSTQQILQDLWCVINTIHAGAAAELSLQPCVPWPLFLSICSTCIDLWLQGPFNIHKGQIPMFVLFFFCYATHENLPCGLLTWTQCTFFFLSALCAWNMHSHAPVVPFTSSVVSLGAVAGFCHLAA